MRPVPRAFAAMMPLLQLWGVAWAAETGKVIGRVSEQGSGAGLPQANVVVVGQGLGAATDNEGRYVILGVPVGRHTVEASMIGFRTVTVTGVRVEADRTVTVDFRLEPATIEMPGVVVKAERPLVSKEMVAARYAVEAGEVAYLPADRLTDMAFFAPGVVRTESTYHVRGGRAAEVDYLVDGVSVVDPLTGEFGLELSRGVADEVVFMPGGLSAEYGQAMSGIVSLITVNPKPSFGARIGLKSEKPMPFYYDFGYTDQGLAIHVPVTENLRAVVTPGLTTVDDWDPRLFKLPHKERADYSLYGKTHLEFGGKVRLAVSGAASRTEFDRYKSEWRLRLSEYRSDLRHGNLLVGKLVWMPNSRSFYDLSCSRFATDRTFGVREAGVAGIFEDFRFRDSSEYVRPDMDMDNPWGYPYWGGPYKDLKAFYTAGTYPEYRRSSSRVVRLRATANNQVVNSHQFVAGAEARLYSIESDGVRWPAWNPVRDSYTVAPKGLAGYVEDRIEYEGLYANLGLRYDRFDPAREYVDTVAWVGYNVYDTVWKRASAKSQLSPRLGASFRITDWLFARTSFGYYFQVPVLSALYDNAFRPVAYRDTQRLVVGQPDLGPERTRAYELGLQGAITDNFALTTNLWRKDVKDLIGTRSAYALPKRYITYVNVDYARLSGVELIAQFRNDFVSTKLSYTYSRAIGTSSYANEAYDEFLLSGDTSVPTKEYTLDFDQPHRAFLQLDLKAPERALPWRWANSALERTELHLLGYVGTGFPYTMPEEKRDPATWNTSLGPMRSNVDMVVTKTIQFGRLELGLLAEVLNLLDVRDVLYVEPSSGRPDRKYPEPVYTDFERPAELRVRFADPSYHPARDYDHNGYISQYEEWRCTVFYHRASVDWVNNYGPPRRARLGFELRW